MIKITLNNQLLNSLIKIEQNKTILENTKVPVELSNKFKKNEKKKFLCVKCYRVNFIYFT